MKGDESADLTVDYQVAISKKEKWEHYEDWSVTGYYSQPIRERLTVIDIGTLAVDMYDPTAKRLVWTGRASKSIDLKASLEGRKKILENALRELLKNFPPK